MADLVWLFAIMLVLMVLKGFFSGTEIALVNADRIHLRSRAARGDRGAAAVLDMETAPERYLATTLVGTNLAMVSLTTLGTLLMIRLFGERGDLYGVLIMSPLFLVLTEVVPKSIFQQRADRIAPIVIRPLRTFMTLLYPVILLFAAVARFAARRVGNSEMQHVFMTRAMVKTVLDTAEKAADVSDSTWSRLKRAVRLSEVNVGEVMIPIAEVTAVGHRESTARAVELACSRGHFRLPVFGTDAGSVVGVLALDIWSLMDPELRKRPLDELVVEPAFVIAQQPVYELIPLLQARPDRMAVVVDEFGSAVGMITLEDIHEAVVGDVVGVGYNIPGYVHRPKQAIVGDGEAGFLVDGRVPVAELNDELGASLPTSEAHTIGGLIMARVRHLPQVGETVVIAGYRFTVEEASGRAVGRVRVESA